MRNDCEHLRLVASIISIKMLKTIVGIVYHVWEYFCLYKRNISRSQYRIQVKEMPDLISVLVNIEFGAFYEQKLFLNLRYHMSSEYSLEYNIKSYDYL